MPKIPPESKSRAGEQSELFILAETVKRLEHFDALRYGDGKGGPFDFSRQAGLLHLSLLCAVPLWIMDLRAEQRLMSINGFADQLTGRAQKCGHYLAEHGDALMFKVKGKSAEAFNHLAEGIACCAFCPGGVTVFGSHWEAKAGA